MKSCFIIWCNIFIFLNFLHSHEILDTKSRNIDRKINYPKVYYSSGISSKVRRHIEDIVERTKSKIIRNKRYNKRGLNRTKNNRLDFDILKGSQRLGPSGMVEFLELGETYCYPNPAKKAGPIIHIETSVEINRIKALIYDITGRKTSELIIGEKPAIKIIRGESWYIYEKLWDISEVGSGVYVFDLDISYGGKNIKRRLKCAVIK